MNRMLDFYAKEMNIKVRRIRKKSIIYLRLIYFIALSVRLK